MTTSPTGRILIVDDVAVNRLTLLRAVEVLGHTGSLAESGRQAIEMITADPSYDSVLLDILMPEMDGFEVLAYLKDRAAYRDIPVIVISGISEMDSAARCIELGAEDYLTKPFDPILLRARINASLSKKRLRDLERDYLEQEMTLRQSEKLASLGRLAAGMAHELNNPATAAQRGVDHLQSLIRELRQTYLRLAELGLSTEQRDLLAPFELHVRDASDNGLALDPLEFSDREMQIDACLYQYDIDQPWLHSASLVELSLDQKALVDLLNHFEPVQIPVVVSWLSGISRLQQLMSDIDSGLQRIMRVVSTIKSYSFMDQAPVQIIDVHRGLESGIELLALPPDSSIEFERQFDTSLPKIEAYGRDLNQVWSNILDNAVKAVGTHGVITLRTTCQSGCIRVEIRDDGVGIPDDVLPKVFDPFFSTRPEGQGAGLGLTISRNIVLKHGGNIEVTSVSGSTCVAVTLPLLRETT